MSQITLNIDKETKSIIQQIAQSANLEPSQWLSQFVEQQIKLDLDWLPEVRALTGSWGDFPSLDDIRDN